jgi:PAS domain S-box-containing protein
VDELGGVVDLLDGLVWCALPSGHVELVNRGWREYTGLDVVRPSEDEFRGTIHPDDLPGWLERWRTIASSREPWELELRLRRADGAFRWFLSRVCPQIGASEQVVWWCGIDTDIDDRRRAEAHLHTVESTFSGWVESFPGLMVTLNVSGQVELFSREVLDYFGKTREELRTWSMTDAVHPDDLPGVVAAFTESVTTGKPYSIEHRCRRADGVYRWFQVRALSVRDQFDRIAGWYVVLVDIDEAKHAEDAIRGNERNLALIINTIPALAWSANVDGSAEFFNQHFLDYTGLTADQAKGWGWVVIVHPDDMGVLVATWQHILASDAPGEAEARLRGRDGTFRWFLFRANPLRDESGTILKWYGVNTDIEDRKRATDALRRSESFLLQIQEVSHTGGWRYDVATDLVESSPEIQRVYGIQPDEDITRPAFWFDRIHPEERDRIRALFEQCMRDKTDYQSGYRILLPDGGIKYQYATGHPIVDTAGNLVAFIGASMDMTEHWLATTELQRASEALRELQTDMARAAQVTAVGELAASIAHEVNQPLSAILTNASTGTRMLDGSPPNLNGVREVVRRIARDGNRAVDVITRLRALFSKKALTLESLDLNEATREVLALSSSDLQRNCVVLRSELADDLPPVTGDRIQLQQVILNLVRNASDAMADVHDRARQLVLRTEHEGPWARVTVRDAGVGLDHQAMDKLFDPFYTTKREGMGIGLSVSRSIIERHHGRISAAPNNGPGATFSFTIPCEEASPADAPAEMPCEDTRAPRSDHSPRSQPS